MASDNQDEFSSEERKTPPRFSGPSLVVPLLILAMIAGYLFVLNSGPKRTEIPYSFFLDQLAEKNVAEVQLFSRLAFGKFKEPPLLPEPDGDATSTTDASKSPERTADANKSTKRKEPRRAEPYFTVTLPERPMEDPQLGRSFAKARPLRKSRCSSTPPSGSSV